METGQVLFRFNQINDMHVKSLRSMANGYAGANDRCKAVVAHIHSSPCLKEAAFTVCVGDLIHGENLEAFAADFETARELLEPLSTPFYPVPGNHEVKQREGDAVYQKPYQDAFGSDRLNYTFEQGGLVFVVLNNSGACCVKEDVVASRAEWLKDALKRNAEKEKIVFCHVPLVPMREEKVLAESFGFSSDWDHDGRCLEILEAHADSVLAVGSGHLHLTGVRHQKGIAHICVSGTASYPSDSALWSVFSNRIEVDMWRAPAETLAPETNLHGQYRHGRDFIDAEHPTPEEYVAGRSDERHVKISRKRLPGPGRSEEGD